MGSDLIKVNKKVSVEKDECMYVFMTLFFISLINHYNGLDQCKILQCADYHSCADNTNAKTPTGFCKLNEAS